MGTYATTTSFSTWLIGTSLDTATTSLLGQCITWAEAEVNKHLAKRYDLSAFQTTVPPLVRSLTEQYTTGLYYQNSVGRGANADGMKRGQVFLDRVLENLKDLGAGKMELVNTAGSAIVGYSSTGVLSNTDDYTSTFAEDDPLLWAVDPDKLDDISTNRG